VQRRNILAAGAAAIAAPVPRNARAQDARRATIAMDWAFQGVTAPWTMAQDRGWFREAGADIVVNRGFGSGDTVVKVASGASDMGYADIYTLVRFLGQNPSQRLVAFFMVHDRSASSICVLADGPIARPIDLVGRKLAAPAGDSSRVLFPLFARKAGFDPARVNWIDVSADLRETMLVRRQADGVSGLIPTISMNLKGVGLDGSRTRYFPYGDFGLPLYGHVLFTTEAFAQANAAILTATVRGTVRGLRAMIADPVAAAEAANRREPLLDVTTELERIRLCLDTMFVTPHVRANGFGRVDMARLDSTVVEVSGAFGLARPIPASELYTERFLPPAADLAFTI
jgi:NitT/TauT family transport system substrate-binding protein